nr:arylesterase [Algicella marina]
MAEETVILALGDSLTQGFGLPEEEGFVPQMQAWLRNEGAEVRIINGGVSGDTSAGGLARTAWSLTPEVEAVIVNLGANDMLRGVDPADTRANIDGILTTIDEKGLPVLITTVPSAGNFGAYYKKSFDAVFPELAEQYGALLYPNFFAALGGENLSDARQWMQGDGIHPNAEGVGKIVEAMGPAVLDLIDLAAD